MKNINTVMYYILYNKLIMENEELYIKWYFKNNKLTQEEEDNYMRLQF